MPPASKRTAEPVPRQPRRCAGGHSLALGRRSGSPLARDRGLVNNPAHAGIRSLRVISEPVPRASDRCPFRLAGLLLLLSTATAAEPAGNYSELSRVFYDFEVASYCALVTHDVGNGFRREADRLIRRDGLDRETVNQLRGDAWQAAHAEWQNRGLGGFRNWCRTEGSAAADRFSAKTPGSAP
jgi:hypothetical protein